MSDDLCKSGLKWLLPLTEILVRGGIQIISNKRIFYEHILYMLLRKLFFHQQHGNSVKGSRYSDLPLVLKNDYYSREGFTDLALKELQTALKAVLPLCLFLIIHKGVYTNKYTVVHQDLSLYSAKSHIWKPKRASANCRIIGGSSGPTFLGKNMV